MTSPVARAGHLEMADTADVQAQAATGAPPLGYSETVDSSAAAAATQTPTQTSTQTSKEPLRGGTCVGQYELIRELGRGGMGRVFLARDVRLARRVAIKFLTSTSPALSQQLVQEARTTARCKHENIVVIYDADEYAGRPYMVLEYLEGRTLRALLRERDKLKRPTAGGLEQLAPISVDRAIDIAIPVVRALQCAHEHGIVHRDLKPDNIMMADAGPIKVLDFGIAKRASDSSPHDDERHPSEADYSKTQTGALVGTVPYMSPEQWLAEGIDHRTDIWAMGIILHQMVTGRHPLAPLDQTSLMSLANPDVPMPRLAESRPDLGAIAAIIDRCLLKRKSDRTSTAGQLLAELEPLRDGRDTAAHGAEDDNPFTGLAAFQEGDARRYFGRDREVAAMVRRLRNQRFVVVAGPSGAGKSSFIRAGVIPALRRSGDGWDVVTIRPGRNPLGALAQVLSQLRGDQIPTDMETTLRTQPGRLGAALRSYCRQKLRKVLLFVDQFEELYTLSPAPEARSAFGACLRGVADDESSPLRVALAVRSDFLDWVADDRSLSNNIGNGLVLLPSMDRQGLQQALRAPVDRAGYRFESEALVADMLDTLENTRCPLPLLQFVGEQLWDHRDVERRVLTRASHDALGGIGGALAKHADAVIAGLSAREQGLARAVLTQLVTAERTRAIVTRDELLERVAPDDDGREHLDEVIQRLASARLVVIETDTGEAATFELIHESLITRWPRLHRWLDETDVDAEFLARLQVAARQWQASGHADGLLWRRQAADDARQWLHKLKAPGSTARVGEREQRFLRAVVSWADRTRRWRRRMLIITIASLSVAAIVVSYLAVRANRAAQRADHAAQRADSATARVAREAVQARNATRMAAARALHDDPTAVLSLLRELEPGPVPPGWHTLTRRALHADVAEIALPHPAAVRGASFSPDGRFLATAAEDGIARVFATDTWSETVRFLGHEKALSSIDFNADGTRLVTASADHTARIWRADGIGQPVVLRGHTGTVTSARFNLDGTRVATTSADGTARLWTVADGSLQTVLSGHKDIVFSAAFDPRGAVVATASLDKTMRLWSLDDGREVQVIAHPDFVHGVDFHPTGTLLLSACHDGITRLWNADGSGPVREFNNRGDMVQTAVFSADGARIATASVAGKIHLWPTDGEGDARVFSAHRTGLYAAALEHQGRRLASSSGDGSVRVWNLARTPEPLVLRAHESTVYGIAFRPDGRQLVSGSADGAVMLWATDGTDGPLHTLRGHESVVTSTAFSPDGRHLASASADGTIRIWTADGTGAPIILRGHETFVSTVSFSPDGARIVSSSGDRTVRIWSVAGTEQPTILRGHESYATAAHFSADGTRIVSASYDKTARIWSLEGNDAPQVLRGHESVLNSAQFSPDGTRVVTASDDKTARIWNADGTGQPVILRGHQSIVGTGGFSPDGALIITHSGDQTVRIWRADGTGEPVILRGHTGEVKNSSFSPDGTRAVSVGEDMTIRVWSDLTAMRPDDERLWPATSYCLPITDRQRMLGTPPAMAASNHRRCVQRAGKR